ncbi:MAG: ATP-dependent helicase/nuclease subunit A, partial [Kiritimatiellia bacterium]
ALLDPVKGTTEGRDRALFRDIPQMHEFMKDIAKQEIKKKGKASATTLKRLAWTRRQAACIERGSKPSWSDLAAARDLFKIKALADISGGLRAQFDIHPSHPRLHDELAQMLTLIFGHAAQVNRAFVQRKQAERLLDFEDMLAQAATILVQDTAKSHLAGRIDLLLVDEFQDTSPVQLQMILALAKIAKRTIWVGDRKQSIFGFQGSDPALMESATTAVLDGRPPVFLKRSFRSRPGLVRLCSTVFARAMEPHGFDPSEVALEPACPESPGHKNEHSLHLWDVGKSEEDPKARISEGHGIAAHIQGHLQANSFTVREHLDDPTQTAPTRPAQPGDIAVLARTNKECSAIAAALKALGVPARVAQEGLGSTPEAKLLRSGLAMLADPSDRMAAAEIAWFSGDVSDPDKWLTDRITKVQAGEGTIYREAFQHIPTVAAMRALTDSARRFSPDEAVVAVMDALNLPERALSWPDPRRHLANLEALRAVVDDYQSTCAARRTAATIAGLVLHIDSLPSDTPQAMPTTDNAVRVLTYHKAKGLEWPVVVLANLNKSFGTRLFDVRVEPADVFDPSHPLRDRQLRWWPWPYGAKKKGFTYADKAAAHPTGIQLERKQKAENARLLYVGFTRARDHLCLVRFARSTALLDQLVDVNDELVLDLPWTTPGDQVVQIGSQDWPCRVSFAAGVQPALPVTISHDARWFKRPASRTVRPAQPVRPSAQELNDNDASAVAIANIVSLGDRQPLRANSSQMNLVGDTIHNFFAADPGGASPARQAFAQQLIDRVDLTGQIDARTIVDMADRFDRWLGMHSSGQRLPEWPVRWRRHDGTVMSGDIDLLVDLGAGWLLIDHKSFPGDTTRRDAKLKHWAGQLDAYRCAIEAATGRPVLECWVHLPVRSELVRLDVPHSISRSP